MNSVAPHPDPDTLLRLIDEDLSPTESLAIANHLLGCGDCRDRMDAVRDALDGYARFHHDILKPAQPAPPAWRPLQFPQARRRTSRPAVWMLAAAAAIAAVVFIVSRTGNPSEVRAAELLHKAAAAEKSATPSKRHVQIRRRGRTLNWPARPQDDPALQAMFQSTGYPWRDPLSVSAYEQWRDALPKKHSEVRVMPAVMVVHTSTPAGALSDAALTLRSADLHAIACTLRFRSSGDVIEMAEVQEQPDFPALPPRAEPTIPHLPALATIADELHVILALHKIQADLGEPIGVERNGAHIEVESAVLNSTRRDQIREALSGNPIVELHFEGDPIIDDGTAQFAAADMPVGLTDAVERAVDRTYALRALARRFSPAAEAQLSGTDVALLKGIVRDHAAALGDAVHAIRRIMALDLDPSALPEPPSTETWRSIAENVPALAGQLDHALNSKAAATDAHDVQLSRLLLQLDHQARVLRNPR